jgi:hypothetical protein
MVFGTVLSLTTTLSLSCIYNPESCNNGSGILKKRERESKLEIIFWATNYRINRLQINTYLIAHILASQANPPPLITYGPSPQTLIVHDIAILPCLVGGDDQPNITWYHNSEKVEQNSRISQSASGTLRLSDLK